MGSPLLFVPLYSNCSYLKELSWLTGYSKTNIKRVVFGDLHLENIRSWRENNFRHYVESFGGKMYFPLWNKSYQYLLASLEESKARAYLSAIVSEKLKTSYKVGDEFNRKLFNALKDCVYAFCEEGEFHTLVEVPDDFMK